MFILLIPLKQPVSLVVDYQIFCKEEPVLLAYALFLVVVAVVVVVVLLLLLR